MLLANLQLGTGTEAFTIEGFLSQSLHQDVRQVAVMTPSDFSKDHVLDLVLTAQAR